MRPPVVQLRRALVAIAGVGLTCACATTSVAPSGPSPFPLARPSTAIAGPVIEREPASVPGETHGVAPMSVEVVTSALALRGTPYRFGGATPAAGFDCSGFVAYVLALHAVVIPRSVAGQYTAGRSVGRDRLRAGDLVFFSTTRAGPTHVGIVTNVDRAEFVHAPANGSVVRIDRFDAAYWRTRWVGARRVVQN